MKKKGLRTLFLATFIGICIGGLIRLERYAAVQLVGLLDDELQSAVPCSLEYDSAAISFVSLSGKVKNPRVVCDKETFLQFESIQATFSLTEVFNKVVRLTNLTLTDGHARGVGPDSPTYKFIDYLSTPLPPEKDRPGRWKLQLETLDVKDSTFIEELGQNFLNATGVSLSLHYNENRDAVLTPRIESLAYVIRGSEPRQMPLGTVTSDVIITDHQTLFRNLKATDGKSISTINADATKATGNSLTGDSQLALSLRYIGLPEWLIGKIAGSATVSGTIASPILTGSFSSADDVVTRISPGGLDVVLFEKISGQFTVDMNHRKPIVTVTDLNGIGSDTSLTMERPLVLNDDALTGVLNLKAGSIVVGPVTFREVSSKIELSGVLGDVLSKAKGTVGYADSLGATLKGFSYEARGRGDLIEFEALHTNPFDGTVNAKGAIDISGKAPLMKDVTYSIKNFPWKHLYSDTVKTHGLDLIRVDALGKVSGPFSPDDVFTKAEVTVRSPLWKSEKNLSGIFTTNQGKLQLNLIAKDSLLKAKVDLGLTELNTKGTYDIDLPLSNLEGYDPKLSCSRAAGKINYTFQRNAPKEGSGTVHINTFELGCAPYTVSIKNSPQLQIRGGTLELGTLAIESLKSSINVKGSASFTKGLSITTAGTLPLRTFSALVPIVDDISGDLDLAISLKGTTSEPSLQGRISVSNASLSVESTGLDITQLNGTFAVQGTRITPQNVTGLVNGGTVRIQGDIDPFNIESSRIGLIISDASFQPLANVSLTTDATLMLESRADLPATITGTIELTNAEFEKRLDLITLVRQFSSFLFSVKNTEQTFQKLPPIGLDIKLSASRNTFVITNYFGSELKANIHLGGTLAAPNITGTMDSLSGWFGLKDQRFDMTSGQIIFTGGIGLPEINITGETTVRSRVGDTITVYLEAKGSITAPRVILTSDSGLSQRELLALITSGGQAVEQTLVNKVGRDFDTNGYSILDTVPILSYSRFFRNLTRVDSLSVEPQYNVQTGAIEPIIAARRRLTDVLSLVGESYLGSQVTETRFGVVYNMLPYLNVAGYLTSSSDKENVALEGDVTLTVLAAQKRFVDITITGNSALSERDILKSLKLRDNSRIPIEEMKRIRQAVKSYYRQNGYFDARIKSICRSDRTYCRAIELLIEEGIQSTIRNIEFEGDQITPVIGKDIIPSLLGDPALSKTVVAYRNQIIRKLRSEGYIAARVEAQYRVTEEENKRDIVFTTTLGRPVSFVFQGHTQFSDEEFLETLNLFRRKIPFGSNTINILVRNIDLLYRENGFLYATIQYSESTDPETGRVTYVITIVEEKRAQVADVQFEGLPPEFSEKLQKTIRKKDPQLFKNIFHPSYALSEVIEDTISQVKKLLKDDGFPQSEIGYRIEPIETGDVHIVYVFSLGVKAQTFTVSVQGLPTNTSLPPPPTGKVFVEAINSYINTTTRALEELGYLAPSLSTIRKADTVSIDVSPGIQSKISQVTVEGVTATSIHAVEELIDIAQGDALDTTLINETRRKLLKLGLFSRVDVEQVDDSTPGNKKVIFRVTEKPLQSLDIGSGFNTEYGIHVYGEGTDRSLFADGRTLTLRLDAYVYSPSGETISKGIASIKYSDPSILGSRYTLTEDLRFQKYSSSTQEFDLDRTSLASNIYRAWESGLSVSVGHTVLSENLDNVTEDVILSEFDSGNVFLGFLNTVLTYDRRDNPLNPSKGYSITLDSKLASPAVGSEASFYGVGGKATFTYPFFIGSSQFAFANALRGGSAWAFSNTEYVPISQRFYLGGRNTVRGYGENSLGPRGAQEGVIGGDSVLSNNFEFQYRPTENTSINLFFDMGNVYLADFNSDERSIPDDIQREDETLLRYSTGVGLRYLSPIGPIGLDLGFPIERRDSDDPWRIHFTIGTNF